MQHKGSAVQKFSGQIGIQFSDGLSLMKVDTDGVKDNELDESIPMCD